jgi:hypothetical protein
MKQKDMYTLDELCDNLTISLSEFSEMSGVNEGTLARIRKGYTARRKTVNRLLAAFSEVHGIELSLDNVTGITLEDKKAIRRQMLERKGLTEKAEETPAPKPVVPTTKPVVETAPKRVYTRKYDSNLPDGCIPAIEFAKMHGISREAMRWHMDNGLGPGLIGTSTETIPERDRIKYEQRIKRVRKNGTEYERYLTADQQAAALDFWKRHDVSFTECDREDCSCHTLGEN